MPRRARSADSVRCTWGLSVVGSGNEAAHGVVRDADTRNLLGLAVEVQAVRASGSGDPALLASATVSLADYGAESALYGAPRAAWSVRGCPRGRRRGAPGQLRTRVPRGADGVGVCRDRPPCPGWRGR